MAGQSIDLFLDQLVDAPIKDERALMEFPFFSLRKQPRMTPFVYDDGTVKIEIQPGARGIATIWDKDLLIYLASLLNDRIERDDELSKAIRFPAYDFLRTTSRGTGKRAYELFLDALFRLRSTTILTTIAAGGKIEAPPPAEAHSAHRQRLVVDQSGAARQRRRHVVARQWLLGAGQRDRRPEDVLDLARRGGHRARRGEGQQT